MKKIYKLASGVSATIAGIAVGLLAHAQTAIVVPTSTANSLTGYVGSQFTDSGTLTVVVLAIAIPLFFYVVHQVMGLLPKSRGGRRQ